MSVIKPYFSSNVKAMMATQAPKWRQRQLVWNQPTTEKYMYLAEIREGGSLFKNLIRGIPCVPEYYCESFAVLKMNHLSRLEKRELSQAEMKFHRTEAKLSAVAMGATTLMGFTPIPIVSGIALASTFPFSYVAFAIASVPPYLARFGVDYHLYSQGRAQQIPLREDG